MAEPAKIDLTTVKRGDTYIVDFFFTDTDGTKDISAVTIDAQARREMDGALWFDLKPKKIDAANGHFRIHLTHDETRGITESPPGSFSGIYDIQFSWAGATETYVSTVVAGSISISKDVTQPVSLVTSGTSGKIPPSSQDINIYYSLNPGTPNYSDVVTAEQLTPVQYDLVASLGLANVNAINEAGEAAKAAKQSAAEALASKNAASQSEKIATLQATKATTEAAKAEKAANDAVAVVTGGTATLVPSPGKIPLADSKGHIDNDWLEPQLMSEAEAMAIADMYENMFDASGMVHMGRHYDDGNNFNKINEGLFTGISTQWANQVLTGELVSPQGTSETKHAVTYIAGAISNVITKTSGNSFAFELPEAEPGTRVYDSTGDVRGSGKASLDFRFDVDPKYGNAPTGTDAQILREGQGRSFEGLVKNGDFRDGTTSWGNFANYATFTVTDGVLTITSSTSSIGGVQCNQYGVTAGKEYVVGFYLHSGAIRLRRTITQSSHNPDNADLGAFDSVGYHEVRYTAPTGYTGNSMWFETVDMGNLPTISGISIRPVTEEVVTHPVDLLTWESFDEELTGRQEIMECVGSLATTFGTTSVPTVLSTRPLSYFQQYAGQFDDPSKQNDRYRCVVWTDLTNAQKREVAAYMGNKLYKGKNGFPVNRRLRPLTFRGLGNGDWQNIDSNDESKRVLSYAQGMGYVFPQGDKDTASEYSNYYDSTYGSNNPDPHKGVFTTRLNSNGYEGRCFLYVVASVPRANQGAYHKNLNPWGCKQWKHLTIDNQAASWSASVAGVGRPVSQSQCFIQRAQGDNKIGAASWSGSIGSASGHPDGLFYDGITAGGLNGVIDWRLPAVANDTPEEQAKVQAKVENKTFRGLEKLVETVPFDNDGSLYRGAGNASHTLFRYALGGATADFHGAGYPAGSPVVVWQPASGGIAYGCVSTNSAYLALSPDSANYGRPIETFVNDPTSLNTNDPVMTFITRPTNLSVSGEFNTSMVIGDPANLLQVDALKAGWLGTWCPDLRTGTQTFALTRKKLGTDNPPSLYSDDFGTTWTSNVAGVDEVTNTWNHNQQPTRVSMIDYTAYAKVTKPSSNKAVYNGKKGLMPVFVTNDSTVNYGCTFAESLISKVLKGNYSSSTHETLALTRLPSIATDGSMAGNSNNQPPVHAAIALPAPQNNSPAVKVLPYQISENGQCSIGYQANELTWGNPTFVTANETFNGWTAGTFYRVTSGDWRGYYKCVLSAAEALTNASLIRGLDGTVRYTDGRELLVWLGGTASGWGDDDKIKVTASGSATFDDRNGNTNLQVSHELAMKSGWTSNHARVGPQVPGIDL